jgi:peptide chain release factor 1
LVYKDFGKTILKISGKNSNKLFENQIGLHQWQRIPPTEKRNRTHTSLVAVLMYEESETKVPLNENELEISKTRGSGNGGQARNKLETCVIVKHKKSGISVRCQTERSQLQNKMLAIELLKAKLDKIEKEKLMQKVEENRISQVGNLKRGSDKKVKIYKEKLNLVVDVKTSKKSSLTEWLKGNM